MPKKKKGKKDSQSPEEPPLEIDDAKVFMPSWAKLLVGLTISGWVALTAAMIFGLYCGVKAVQQASNPVYIAKNVEKIVHFNDALPSGFQYQFSVSTVDATVVSFFNKEDQTIFFLISAKPKEEQQSETAKQLTNELAANGLYGISRPLKIKTSNTVQVAGQSMEYILGTPADHESDSADSFLGSIVLSDKRAIALFGITPPKQENGSSSTFNMDACNKFLASIKSF